MPQLTSAKSILNKTKRRDSWFLDDYTVNPYSGCSFNCLYCYIRGSKYGIYMQEKMAVKENAAVLLDKQLAARARKGQHGFIVLSSATDPYLQLEKTHRITRSLLEVIARHRFPLHVVTKSDLITRDFDLLSEVRKNAILPANLSAKVPGLFVTFSFSTTDDSIARIFEPGATPPSARLLTLKAALGSGFYAGVSLMPLLPYITDTGEHLAQMFSQFAELNAKYVMPATLTLFGHEKADSRVLTMAAVNRHYPHLAEKYERFFSDSTEMPAYYRNAFYGKMKALSGQYQLPDRIVSL